MNHPLSNVAFGKATQSAASQAVTQPPQRLDTAGKTVEQVWSELSSMLRRSELEPEWICPANLNNDPDEATSGHASVEAGRNPMQGIELPYPSTSGCPKVGSFTWTGSSVRSWTTRPDVRTR